MLQQNCCNPRIYSCWNGDTWFQIHCSNQTCISPNIPRKQFQDKKLLNQGNFPQHLSWILDAKACALASHWAPCGVSKCFSVSTNPSALKEFIGPASIPAEWTATSRTEVGLFRTEQFFSSKNGWKTVILWDIPSNNSDSFSHHPCQTLDSRPFVPPVYPVGYRFSIGEPSAPQKNHPKNPSELLNLNGERNKNIVPQGWWKTTQVATCLSDFVGLPSSRAWISLAWKNWSPIKGAMMAGIPARSVLWSTPAPPWLTIHRHCGSLNLTRSHWNSNKTWRSEYHGIS